MQPFYNYTYCLRSLFSSLAHRSSPDVESSTDLPLSSQRGNECQVAPDHKRLCVDLARVPAQFSTFYSNTSSMVRTAHPDLTEQRQVSIIVADDGGILELARGSLVLGR